MTRRLAPLLAVAVAAACAYGYQARGRIDGGELLVGNVRHDLAGGGHFFLRGASGLACDGVAEAPTTPGRDGRCSGEGGRGTLRCSDGRVFSFDWQATSCRSFTGSGRDGEGRAVEFAVRHQ